MRNLLIAVTIGLMATASPAFALNLVFTGSSDVDMFAATGLGGSTITYTATTIDFTTLPHPGNFVPPLDYALVPMTADLPCCGDVSIEMDFATTDIVALGQSGGGYIGMGVSLFLANGRELGIGWATQQTNNPGMSNFSGYYIDGALLQNAGDVESTPTAATGAVTLRLTRVGDTFTAAYTAPGAGTFTDLYTFDMTAHPDDGDISAQDIADIAVFYFGEDGVTFAPVEFSIEEIRVDVDVPFTISGPSGPVSEGGAFTLTGPSGYSSYQWFQDGSPLTNDAHRTGSMTDTLDVTSATIADSGDYTLRLDDGSKALVFTNPFTVNVISATLPTSGIAATAFLLTAILAGGIVFLRKRSSSLS